MKYLTKYKLFESSEDINSIEQYLDDLFLELGDGNFIYTILNIPQSNRIKIIIGKLGYKVFGYEEVKDLVNHAVSYLKENGYELLPDMQKDLPYYDETCLKSLELQFKMTGVKESIHHRTKQDIEADINHIFDDLKDNDIRVDVIMSDKVNYIYIDRDSVEKTFDGPTIVDCIERLKIFLKGTPFEISEVVYESKSMIRSLRNKGKGISYDVDRFINFCRSTNNLGKPVFEDLTIVKIFLKQYRDEIQPLRMPVLKKYESFSSYGRALLIHGYGTNAQSDFHPWLKRELEKLGYIVELPNLPHPDEPSIDEQVGYIMDNYPQPKKLILGHSLGCVVALKMIEEIDYDVDDLVLVSGFIDTNFNDGDEDIDELLMVCDWKFNYNLIKSKVKRIHVLRPEIDTAVTLEQTKDLSKKLGVPIHFFKGMEDHACGEKEPGILNYIKNL